MWILKLFVHCTRFGTLLEKMGMTQPKGRIVSAGSGNTLDPGKTGLSSDTLTGR